MRALIVGRIQYQQGQRWVRLGLGDSQSRTARVKNKVKKVLYEQIIYTSILQV